MALVLLTPLIVMAPPFPTAFHTFFPFIVGKALYARTLTEIALGLWLVLSLRYPAYRMPRSRLLLVFGVYIVVTFAAALAGVSSQRSLWSTYERMIGFVDLAHWFAYAVVVASVFRSWADWRALLNVNLVVSVVMGLLGLSQHFDLGILAYLETGKRLDITLGNPTYVGGYMLVNVLIALGFLGRSYLGGARPDVMPTRRRRRARSRRAAGKGEGFSGLEFAIFWVAAALLSVFILDRVRSAYADGRTGVTLAAIALAAEASVFVVSYVFFQRQREWTWRIFWTATVLLDVWILYLSGTRGALMALGVAIIAFSVGYLLWGHQRLLKQLSIALVATVVALTVIVVLARNTAPFQRLADSSFMLFRIATFDPGGESVGGRIISIKVGLQGFAARPLLGWGPENFAILHDRYITAEMVAHSTVSFDQAHNKPIEELATKGILGFAAYAAIWLYMLRIIVRKARDQGAQDQVFTMLVGAALAAYFVQNLFLFDTPGTIVQLMLLVGFVAYLETAGQAESDISDGPLEAGPALSYLRSGASFTLALAAMAALVVAAILSINYPPFHGTTAVLDTLKRPGITLEQRLEIFDDAISAFPPQANYLRIVMYNQLISNWRTFSEPEARAALSMADKEGQEAIAAEPEEWRLYLPLSTLFHLGSSLDSSYVARARALVEQATRLAPDRIEVNLHLVRLQIFEKDYGRAQESLDSYLERNPRAAPQFQGLQREIDRLTDQ